MVRWIIPTTAVLALMLGPAAAQSSNSPGASGSQQNARSSGAQGSQSLPQQIQQKLQNQGFSDVKVVPGSFLVSAKDKDGDPVTMVIGPNSMAVFTMSTPDNQTTGSGGQSGGMQGSSGPNRR